MLISLSGHLQSVTCMQWGGEGLIYSGSQDRTIKVWRDDDVCIKITTTFYYFDSSVKLSNSFKVSDCFL